MAQKITYILLIVFASILVYFIVYLIFTHIIFGLENKKKKNLKEKILKSISDNDNTIFNNKKINSKLSIDTVADLFCNMQDSEKAILKSLIKNSLFEKYICKVIKTKKVNEYIIFYIKLAGDLDLQKSSNNIIKIMKKNPNNLDLQYYCLDSLSKLGRKDDIIDFFNNNKIILTSRALQEILADYSGDKEEFYKELLKNEDPYIIRNSILMIGDTKLKHLAPIIDKYINSTIEEICIAAIKTVGRLKYTRSFNKIIKLCDSPSWVIRSTAIKYAGKLNADKAIPVALKLIDDKMWWVRRNAARTIARSSNPEKTVKKLSKLGNKSAVDSVKYAMKEFELKKAGVGNE